LAKNGAAQQRFKREAKFRVKIQNLRHFCAKFCFAPLGSLRSENFCEIKVENSLVTLPARVIVNNLLKILTDILF